jgi:hypothetical protein
MTLKQRPYANIFGPKGGRTLENFAHVGRFSIFDSKNHLGFNPTKLFFFPIEEFFRFLLLS